MLKPILLFVIFLTFIMGLLVASKRTKSLRDRLFSIGTFLALLWTFANYMTGVYPTPFWLEATYSIGALLIGCGILWVLYVTQTDISKRVVVWVCAASAALAVASFVPSFIATHYNAIYFGGVFVGTAGVGLYVYTGLFAVASFIMLRALYLARIREADPHRRAQLGYVFFGMLAILVISGLTSFVLPSLSIFRFGGIDSIGFLIFLLCIGYSILKHNFFDIKIITAEIAIFSLWMLILGAVFFSDSQSERLANIALLVMSIIVGMLLRKSVLSEVRQKEQLRELSAQKSEFLSFATHQLRSPLSVLDGYAEMLGSGEAGPISEKQRAIVGSMRETAGHLSKIVSDFLDSAKIEQGGLRYDMRPADLGNIIRDAAHRMGFHARAKGIDLLCSTSNFSQHIVRCDREMVRQAAENIIDNAIKYTEEGSVRIDLSSDHRGVTLFVKDTGIGIAPELKDALFEKFNRGPHARRASSGSGIGLYLAKEIVEAHGGRIEIASEGMHAGAQVTVWLPAW